MPASILEKDDGKLTTAKAPIDRLPAADSPTRLNGVGSILNQAPDDLLYDGASRGPVETDDVAFGAKLARADVLVGLAALVAAAAAAAIIAAGEAVAEPTALTAVLVANIATLAVAGRMWRRSRPASRVGTLLLVEGLFIAVSSLVGSPNPGAHVVGVLAWWAASDRCGLADRGVPGRSPEGRRRGASCHSCS